MKKKKYYSSPTIEVFYCHLEMLLADTTIETSPGGPGIGHGGEGDIGAKGWWDDGSDRKSIWEE